MKRSRIAWSDILVPVSARRGANARRRARDRLSGRCRPTLRARSSRRRRPASDRRRGRRPHRHLTARRGTCGREGVGRDREHEGRGLAVTGADQDAILRTGVRGAKSGGALTIVRLHQARRALRLANHRDEPARAHPIDEGADRRPTGDERETTPRSDLLLGEIPGAFATSLPGGLYRRADWRAVRPPAADRCAMVRARPHDERHHAALGQGSRAATRRAANASSAQAGRRPRCPTTRTASPSPA